MRHRFLRTESYFNPNACRVPILENLKVLISLREKLGFDFLNFDWHVFPRTNVSGCRYINESWQEVTEGSLGNAGYLLLFIASPPGLRA